MARNAFSDLRAGFDGFCILRLLRHWCRFVFCERSVQFPNRSGFFGDVVSSVHVRRLDGRFVGEHDGLRHG